MALKCNVIASISHNVIILTNFNKDGLCFYALSVLLVHIFDTAAWKTTGKSGGKEMSGVAVWESCSVNNSPKNQLCEEM